MAEAAERIGGQGRADRVGPGRGIFQAPVPRHGHITGLPILCSLCGRARGPAPDVGYMGEAFILEATAWAWVPAGLGELPQKPYRLPIAPGGRGTHRGHHPHGRARGNLCGPPPQKPGSPDWPGPGSLAGPAGMAAKRPLLRPAGPSAVNRQPWRFQPEGRGIRIIKTSGNFGFGGVDLGIAMLHMELGAAHCSVSGQWQEMGDQPLFVPEAENL